VLQVSRTVEFEEIKKSYRRLAVKHHPDKNPGDPTAEERFRELAEAYDILSDPEKRAAYDRYGHAALQGGMGGGGMHDPFDLFREMFGAAGGGGGIFDHFFGGGGGDDGRGSDLRYDLQITLEEAFAGCEKEIELRKLDACGSCEGAAPPRGEGLHLLPLQGARPGRRLARILPGRPALPAVPRGGARDRQAVP